MLKPGIYKARASYGELGTTKTGSEQVVVHFDITEEGFQGQGITWFGVCKTDDQARRVMESLRYCGWQGDDIADLDLIDRNEVELEIEHDEWQGKVSARVKWVNRIGGGGPKVTPLPDDRRAAFAARMRLIAASNPPAAAAQPQAPYQRPAAASTKHTTVPMSAPITDEDIPF